MTWSELTRVCAQVAETYAKGAVEVGQQRSFAGAGMLFNEFTVEAIDGDTVTILGDCCWESKREVNRHTHTLEEVLLTKLLTAAKPAEPAKVETLLCTACGLPGLELGYKHRCWPCELQSEATLASMTDLVKGQTMVQSRQNHQARTWDRLRMEPYDNSVAGIGCFPRIWRLR